MTNRPAIPPPPPAYPTVPTPPPSGCDDLPWPDGEPASGTRTIIDAARLRAEWEREQAHLDTIAPAPRALDYALDAEAGQ